MHQDVPSFARVAVAHANSSSLNRAHSFLTGAYATNEDGRTDAVDEALFRKRKGRMGGRPLPFRVRAYARIWNKNNGRRSSRRLRPLNQLAFLESWFFYYLVAGARRHEPIMAFLELAH